jgi:2-desacetyl-2-hydroxyethyl bacteriochlorophyllide A dehydrogenase
MRGVLFHGPRELTVVDLPLPPLAPDEVRLRVERSGICGSDVASWRGDWPTAVVPSVKGHEVCGTVTEIGAAVSGVLPGMLVAVRPIRGCGVCRSCARGAYNRCGDWSMYGLQRPGGWADEMVVRQDHARPLPPGVTADQAVLTEPLAVVTHAFGLAGSLRGASVAILGAGTLGLLAIQAARLLGATSVYATGRQDRKLALAERFGARVGDARTEDVVAAGLARGGPFDVVLDCIGSSEALNQGLRLAAAGGTVLLVAGPHHPTLELDYVEFRAREVSLIASRIYGADFDDAIALLGRGELDLAPLITHRFDVEHAPEAVAFADANRADAIKVVLQPGLGR